MRNAYQRQTKKYAFLALTIADIGAANEVTIAVPRGSFVDEVALTVVIPFNGTTNTATIGDGTTVFANAVDVATTGHKTTANHPKFYPDGGTITVSMAQTGTATAGHAVVKIGYLQLGNTDAGVQE